MPRLPDLKKLTSLDSLREIIQDQPDKRVIFSGGIFDLLKPFHIDLIEFAGSRGDILVIAVAEAGGYTPLEERLEILDEIENINLLFVYNNRELEKIPLDLFAEIIVNDEFDPPGINSGFSGKTVKFSG